LTSRTIVNAFGKEFQVFINPNSSEEQRLLGNVVRFTADNRTKTVYLWSFNGGHHADVSISLKLKDTFSDRDVLRGAAQLREDVYHFVTSDFFSSFKKGVPNVDRFFLKELFSRDWSWVDKYIRVTDYLEEIKKRFHIL